MKIITSHCLESSRELSQALNEAGIGCDVIDVRNSWEHSNYTGVVFAYGCSDRTERAFRRYNCVKAVERCVNKRLTFESFNRAGIPTVPYCTRRHLVPKHWETVVCRESVYGRKAEGYKLVDQGEDLPDWELFTEYFHHVREYRIVVFMGQAFVYYKREVWDKKGKYNNHEFIFQKPRAIIHHKMMKDAIKAAKALDIDYVGFDVLANSKGTYVFLEANSGAILCEEVKAAIIKHFKTVKGA